jgi:diguanylate cyclase (GGDEF)-like protein
VFVGLPALTVAAGTFVLFLLASDLAEKLRRVAETDSLTGARNRGAVEALAGRHIAAARSAGRPFAVALCDLDQFKFINDRFGHAYGDDVLRAVTHLFGRAMGEDFGRFGGEEFLLLFPDMSTAAARERLEALRVEIAAMKLPQLSIGVTASFGVAELAEGDTLSTLLRRADQALYMSKQRGRNRTSIAASPVSMEQLHEALLNPAAS